MFSLPNSFRSAVPLASPTLKHVFAHTHSPLGAASITTSVNGASSSASTVLSTGVALPSATNPPMPRGAPFSRMYSDAMLVTPPNTPPMPRRAPFSRLYSDAMLVTPPHTPRMQYTPYTPLAVARKRSKPKGVSFMAIEMEREEEQDGGWLSDVEMDKDEDIEEGDMDAEMMAAMEEGRSTMRSCKDRVHTPYHSPARERNSWLSLY